MEQATIYLLGAQATILAVVLVVVLVKLIIKEVKNKND